MRVLFYYPSNKRTIPIDIPLFKLQARGHELFLLTTIERGPLHDMYEKNGANVYSNPLQGNKIVRFIKQVIYLIRFCEKHKIETIHSHLQQANVITVIAGLFIKTRVNVFRHHCKFHFLLNETNLRPARNEVLGDKLINKLSKSIIVPSNSVRKAMIKYEGVSGDKIKIIPYIYDFEKMRDVDRSDIEKIKEKYSASLRIIMVSRLTPYKRHEDALIPIIDLIDKGYDIQVLIMDDGPLKSDISKLIEQRNVYDRVHLLGFQYNILEYLAACDIIVHPSITDASNSAIKEAALMEKIAIVCDEVGDFNDYMISGENGFLLNANSFREDLPAVISKVYNEKESYTTLGANLKSTVLNRFRISEEVVDLYESL